jgi:hypothetical protein
MARKRKKKEKPDSQLTFRDFEDLMKHDSFKRDNGVIKQIRHV